MVGAVGKPRWVWEEMGSEVTQVRVLQISYSDGLPCSELQGRVPGMAHRGKPAGILWDTWLDAHVSTQTPDRVSLCSPSCPGKLTA